MVLGVVRQAPTIVKSAGTYTNFASSYWKPRARAASGGAFADPPAVALYCPALGERLALRRSIDPPVRPGELDRHTIGEVRRVASNRWDGPWLSGEERRCLPDGS
jgi:hypothetical protein